MIIGLISDTHISEKRGRLNEEIFNIFKNADMILHAGDITSQKVLDELEKIAPVTAVLGNNDKLELNKEEFIEVENKKIALVHGHKTKDLYKFGLENNADIVISGHSHRPNFEKVNDICLINPGSPTKPIKSKKSIALLKIEKEMEVEFFEIQ